MEFFVCNDGADADNGWRMYQHDVNHVTKNGGAIDAPGVLGLAIIEHVYIYGYL